MVKPKGEFCSYFPPPFTMEHGELHVISLKDVVTDLLGQTFSLLPPASLPLTSYTPLSASSLLPAP